MKKIEYPKKVDFSNSEEVHKFIECIIHDYRLPDIKQKLWKVFYIFLTIAYNNLIPARVYSFIIYLLGIFTAAFLAAYFTFYQEIFIILTIVCIIVAFYFIVLYPKPKMEVTYENK